MRWSAILATATLSFLLSAGLSAADPFWAQATFVKGDPTVLLSGSGSPMPLQRGAILHRNDRVTVPEKGQVSLLLHSGAVLVLRGPANQVMGFDPPKMAAPELSTVAKNLSKTLLAREGDNPMLKHLGGLRGAERNLAIAPCRTKVRPGTIPLIWSAKPGVKRYAIALMGPDDSLIEGETTETQWTPPSGRIHPGATYYWEVQDAASKDSLTTLGSGSFTVLDAKGASRVEKLLADVRAAFPAAERGEDDSPVFLEYQVFREAGLNTDALGRLANLLKRSPEDAELLRFKRALLTEMGLEEGDEARLSVGDSR